MASKNPDSMTNAQGEFNPRKPPSKPIEKHGHQVGLKSSPADHAPEFSTKILPPGSAPSDATFQSNPINEVPGQALNNDVDRSHGKENVRTDPLSTLPGATSADVHTGLGHPGQGQTSTELRHEGAHTASKHSSGPEGAGASGSSGLRGPDDVSSEFRALQADEHPNGPVSGHNVSRDGAEDKEPVNAEFVAREADKAGEHAQ